MNYLSIENLSKSYGDRLLFADIAFGVDEGEKIGIVARNGTGKSTLLRILAGEESPDDGKVVYRRDLRVGYLPQEPVFAPGITVGEAAVENLDQDNHPTDADAMQRLLTSLGLPDPSMRVDKLSGGQRKKLAIARAIIGDPELLILDEPTNHLDMATKDILKQAIKDFDGTVIVVSHDREFLDGLVEKVYEFGGGLVRECLGGIYEFLEKKRISSLHELELSKSTGKSEAPKTVKTEQAKSDSEPTAAKPRLSYAEQREREKTLRRLQKKVQEAEAEISRLEAEIAAIEAELAAGSTDSELYRRHADTTKALENAMSIWELASMDVDEFGG